jgi:hypothetical protein
MEANMNHSKHEKGQTLIIIAFAVIVLIGFTALAIDGGMIFSDRRHSQNASDTAAFAAALARVRANPNWKQVGLDRATSNDYTNDGTTEVEVYLCSEWETLSGTSCEGLPAGADPSEYVLVRIKSVVKLFFAPLIGWGEVTNRTSAVVHASLPEVTEWYDGNALVSTMLGCKHDTGWPYDPFTIGGNSLNVINGSGIFVNAECPNAFTVNGTSSSTLVADGPVCVVGGANYNPSTIDPDPTVDCGSQINPDKYQLPNPTCSQNGVITESSPGNYVASPGNYSSSFPNVSPAGVLKLQKGIYCLNAGLSVQGTWIITSDLDGDGHDSDSEGVLFYVPPKANGNPNNITFNGTSEINIQAISSTVGGFSEAYLNYLIYVPPSNECTVKITGDDGSEFTGTILAPSCHITLEGSGGAIGVNSQVIGYTVNLSGNGTLNLTYNQSDNAVTTTNPALSATK